VSVKTVLIANRGEIAVRIARACHEHGLAAVAVYSEADRGAPHTLAADRAVPIGPPPAAESYLNVDALLAAARSADADAVHPGYGFLAESAAFARAVEAAGLTWIGPPPEAIATMGDKLAARAAVARAGVPLVPGAEVGDGDAAAAARRLGFPVLVKAAAGGGGKGMRTVASEAELSDALGAKPRPPSPTGACISRSFSSVPVTSRCRCWATATARSSISASASARSSAATRRSSRRRPARRSPRSSGPR
jgi:acetyl/propionyl-CoA carboxylase alpha subunit